VKDKIKIGIIICDRYHPVRGGVNALGLSVIGKVHLAFIERMMNWN